MASVKQRADNVSPQPESSGNESAEQQLFAETQASASKLQQPPITSAIRSANLLNAARVDRRRTIAHTTSSPPPQSTQAFESASSPIDMVRRKGGAGKLKRPSFIREDMARQPRSNLARRGDVFEMAPESPEKSTNASRFKLPQTVNRKPLKRVKKDKEADIEDGPGMAQRPARIEDEGQALNWEPDAAPLSSPVALDENHNEHEDDSSRRKSGRLAGEAAAVSRIDFAETPGSRAWKQMQKKRKADEQRLRTERPSKSPRREGDDASEHAELQPATNGRRNLRSRAKRTNPQVVISTRHAAKQTDKPQSKTRPRAIPDDAEDRVSSRANDEAIELESHVTDKRQGESPLFEPEEQPTKRGKAGKSRATKKTARQEADTASAARASKQTRSRGKQQINQGEDAIEHTESHDEPENDHVERQGSPIDLVSEDDANDHHEDKDESIQDDDLSRVFKFLDSEERQGQCKTKDAVKISRACQAGLELIQQSDLTLNEAGDTTLDIQAMLTNYGANKDDDKRRALKIDAYAYLFRDLIWYLEALYNWLEEKYGDVSQSLETMGIVAPYVQDIISFKDTIASWKAKLPTRYQNDRLIKNVDTNLIVPLRKVGATYRAIWSQLNAAEQRRKAREEHRQRKLRIEEEQMRREEEDTLRKKRWRRWQDLHVWRLQCEPDPFKRRHLRIDRRLFDSKFNNIDERDANGIKFERVPVFKERVSPPANRGSPAAEDAWTNEQEEALIDGLTKYAGPDVFRKIFQKYCRPDGPLRKFTVPDITAQATLLRTDLMSGYQSKGWEPARWIKLIPVLP